MPPCQLSYIPSRLHWDGERVISDFFDTELFYIRVLNGPPKGVSVENRENPFTYVTIAELSYNRSGVDNSISLADDVLWNLEIEEEEERYEDYFVNEFQLQINGSESISELQFTEVSGSDTCVITFEHAPLDCNFAHCNIEFDLNSVRVLKRTYDSSLGSKAHKNIRKKVRALLAHFLRHGRMMVDVPESGS